MALPFSLTLPSSGHATACHAWPSFHSGPCASRRCVPLMSNVRALRMQSLASPKRNIGIAASAPARRSPGLPVLTVSNPSFSWSSDSRWFSSFSAKAGLARRRASQSCGCSHGSPRGVGSSQPHKGASRRRAQRRAVSSLRRFAPAVLLRLTITHRQSKATEGKVVGVVSSNQALACNGQRPNTTVTRTSNGRLRPPSAAGYLRR